MNLFYQTKKKSKKIRDTKTARAAFSPFERIMASIVTTPRKKTKLKKTPRLTAGEIEQTRIQFQHDDELLHTVTLFFHEVFLHI